LRVNTEEKVFKGGFCRKDMTKIQYGVRKAEHVEQLPEIDLYFTPHLGGVLVSARFGPKWYNKNTEAMEKHYKNSLDFPNITFRPATTAESISIASYDFENLAKPEIFDSGWIQAGRIVLDSKGVYANPLTAIKQEGVDEAELKRLLGKAKKVNGVWLGDNDFAFTEYGFKEGVQTAREFAEGRLARTLTHTQGKVSSDLLNIAQTYNDGNGNSVKVRYFDKTNKPVSRVVVLGFLGGLLLVDGGNLNDLIVGGYASGVFDEKAA
jgi:hypothetical protein